MCKLTSVKPSTTQAKLPPFEITSPEHPKDWIVTAPISTLEIKKWWLFSEWDSRNPSIGNAEIIKQAFPDQDILHPETGTAEKQVVEEIFHKVRGQYPLIWGEKRENANWQKIVVEKLSIEWVEKHLIIGWPSSDQFEVTELNGLVLWKGSNDERYLLLEGNHRVNAWLEAKKPAHLPATMYLGTPK